MNIYRATKPRSYKTKNSHILINEWKAHKENTLQSSFTVWEVESRACLIYLSSTSILFLGIDFNFTTLIFSLTMFNPLTLIFKLIFLLQAQFRSSSRHQI